MENLGNGLTIRNVPNRGVVELKTAKENATAHLQQMAAQILLVTELKYVNILPILSL